jgi:Cu+-exporting ATPase
MSGDLAVVMDVAGTILRMYRVAKDLSRDIIMEKVVTWELIMEKSGRALVVPQVDPQFIASCCPDDPVSSLVDGREDCLEISCSSTSLSRNQALQILRRSQVRVRELQEVHRAVQFRCPERYQTTGVIVDADLQEITHAISTGGTPFPGLGIVLRDLQCMGAMVYLASGDSMASLMSLKDFGIDLSRVYPVASPRRKQEIVMALKDEYRSVVMVGDGLNDLYALQAADLGVLSVQQDTRPPLMLRQAADEIIRDIQELPEILSRLRLREDNIF